jgi:hypothetical protein
MYSPPPQPWVATLAELQIGGAPHAQLYSFTAQACCSKLQQEVVPPQ